MGVNIGRGGNIAVPESFLDILAGRIRVAHNNVVSAIALLQMTCKTDDPVLCRRRIQDSSLRADAGAFAEDREIDRKNHVA